MPLPEIPSPFSPFHPFPAHSPRRSGRFGVLQPLQEVAKRTFISQLPTNVWVCVCECECVWVCVWEIVQVFFIVRVKFEVSLFMGCAACRFLYSPGYSQTLDKPFPPPSPSSVPLAPSPGQVVCQSVCNHDAQADTQRVTPKLTFKTPKCAIYHFLTRHSGRGKDIRRQRRKGGGGMVKGGSNWWVHCVRCWQELPVPVPVPLPVLVRSSTTAINRLEWRDPRRGPERIRSLGPVAITIPIAIAIAAAAGGSDAATNLISAALRDQRLKSCA